jgi:hypothetical protein
MTPKLHRRTPSSAHTYRLLIFKEPAIHRLSPRCRSVVFDQQRSGIMRGFLKFVKQFADYFSTRLQRQAVLPVNHRASYYGELSFFRQAPASHFFGPHLLTSLTTPCAAQAFYDLFENSCFAREA